MILKILLLRNRNPGQGEEVDRSLQSRRMLTKPLLSCYFSWGYDRKQASMCKKCYSFEMNVNEMCLEEISRSFINHQSKLIKKAADWQIVNSFVRLVMVSGLVEGLHQSSTTRDGVDIVWIDMIRDWSHVVLPPVSSPQGDGSTWSATGSTSAASRLQLWFPTPGHQRDWQLLRRNRSSG